MSGAANIVNTLKSKIKETADELEKYEGISEETRAKYNSERKAREESTLSAVLKETIMMKTQ